MKTQLASKDPTLFAADAATPILRAGAGTPEEQEPRLRTYLDALLDARWPLLVSALGALAAGVLYLFLATPVFQSDALVQVEEKKRTLSGLEDLSNLFTSQSPADTEIEILRSRMLVGAVVDELRLDVSAEPRFFPVVGRAIARRRGADGPASPVLGLDSYAWGGERITVPRMDVPAQLEGVRLTLVAREGGGYDLLDPARRTLGHGRVGAPFASGGISVFVSQLVARPGTEFRVAKLPRASIVRKLQRDLLISETPKKSGMLRVTLEGSVPERIPAILDAISRTYVRQNVERKSAEAEQTLAFINGQLPDLKRNVDSAEAALNEYRTKHGSVDLGLETEKALDRAVEVEKQISDLQLQVAEARQRFTENHPIMVTARQKLGRLRAERDTIDSRIKQLPDAELRSARLMRDVKVSSELYVLLLNKAQELEVMKSGTIGNVRIIDGAVLPTAPVSPSPVNTLALSLALGLVFGVGLAFARRSLDEGVEDPDAIEREVGLPVYAVIPHSSTQAAATLRKHRGERIPILALTAREDLAVEALRSLRTSLHFALADAPNNVIAVAGPSPGVGKSFIAVNIAHLLADVGKRVLVVDGDLRRGRLHDYFGGTRAPGVSDVVRGTAADAIRSTGAANVHFLAAGERPPNPAELLASQRFEDLVARASRDYDLVVIDTPPVLAVADASIVCRTAGTTLLVLRSGCHPLREISLMVKRLGQNGVTARAIVLNAAVRKAAGYSRYRTGYHYYDYR